jgi:hypothetical protein
MARARRVAVCLLVLGLLGASPMSAASPKKKIKKSYDVQALPFPLHFGERNGFYGCLGGEDGIHKISTPFKAPWSGELRATVDEFRGDWDIYVVNDRGAVLHAANHGISQLALDEPDTLTFDLTARQRVNIVVCNYLGGPTARVSYEFTYKKVNAPRPPKEKTSYVVHAQYQAPSVATANPTWMFLLCYDGRFGCSSWIPGTTERFATVEVKDDSGQPVAAEFYQWTDSGPYANEMFCGKTKEPIPLLPNVSGVGVEILLGPCQDGTPTAPTSGEITVTLSSHPR